MIGANALPQYGRRDVVLDGSGGFTVNSLLTFVGAVDAAGSLNLYKGTLFMMVQRWRTSENQGWPCLMNAEVTAGTNYTHVAFTHGGYPGFQEVDPGPVSVFQRTSLNKHIDPTAWTPVTLMWDTTQAADADKFRVFIGDLEQVTNQTAPALNRSLQFFTQIIHRLFRSDTGYGDVTAKMNVAEMVFLNGVNALPSTFFTKTRNGDMLIKSLKNYAFGPRDKVMVGRDVARGINTLVDSAPLVAWQPDAFDWSSGAQFTHTGPDISRTSTVQSARTYKALLGDFEISFTKVADGTCMRFGVYNPEEDSTFVWSGTDGAGMDSMLDSYYVDFGNNQFRIAGVSQGGEAIADGSVVKITRVDGVISVYDDDVLVHTFAYKYRGQARICIGGGGSTFNITGLTITADGFVEYAAFVSSAVEQLRTSPTNGLVHEKFPEINKWRPGCDRSMFKPWNLTIVQGAGGNRVYVPSIKLPTTGKRRFKYRPLSGSAGGGRAVGVIDLGTQSLASTLTSLSAAWSYDGATGNKYVAGVGTAFGAAWGNRAEIEVLFDADAQTLTFYKDDVLQGTITGVTGSNLYFAIGTENGLTVRVDFGEFDDSSNDSSYLPLTESQHVGIYNAYSDYDRAGWAINDTLPCMSSTTSTADTIIAGTLPDGVRPIATWALPRPRVNPKEHVFVDRIVHDGVLTEIPVGWDVLAYDTMHWVHRATVTPGPWYCVDTLRGLGHYIQLDSDAIEQNNANVIVESAGKHYLGSALAAGTYVVFSARAGDRGGVVNNVGTIPATVSANTESGFALRIRTGTGATGTVGHGLPAAPGFYATKDRLGPTTRSIVCHHVGVDAGKVVYLDQSVAQITDTAVWNSAAADATVTPVGTAAGSNGSTIQYVDMLFAQVGDTPIFNILYGESSGVANQTLWMTGSKSKAVMLKNIDAVQQWQWFDSVSNPNNPLTVDLQPSDTAVEGGNASDDLGFFGNGIIAFGTNAAVNPAATMIGVAVADTFIQGNTYAAVSPNAAAR